MSKRLGLRVKTPLNPITPPPPVMPVWSVTIPVKAIDFKRRFNFKFVINGCKWMTNPDYPEVRAYPSDSDATPNFNNSWSVYEQRQQLPALSPVPVAPLRGWIRYERLGITPIKCALNLIHQFLIKEGYDEVQASSHDHDIVIVRRRRKSDGKMMLFISRAGPDPSGPRGDRVKLALPLGSVAHHPHDSSLKCRNENLAYECQVLVAGAVRVDTQLPDFTTANSPTENNDGPVIKGTGSHVSIALDGSAPRDFDFSLVSPVGRIIRDLVTQKAHIASLLQVSRLPRGSVIVVSLTPAPSSQSTLAEMRTAHAAKLSTLLPRLSLLDLSYLLYSCDQEERDRTANLRGCYNLPQGLGGGSFVYAGLAGVAKRLERERRRRSGWADGELWRNVTDGDWLIDYLIERCRNDDVTIRRERGEGTPGSKVYIVSEGLRLIARWMEEGKNILNKYFSCLHEDMSGSSSAASSPNGQQDLEDEEEPLLWRREDDGIPLVFIVPPSVSPPHLTHHSTLRDAVSSIACLKSRRLYAYPHFDWLVTTLFHAAHHRIIKQLYPADIRNLAVHDPLLAGLSLATLQFYSYLPNSPLDCSVAVPSPSISAGLPFFSAGFMRAWGRDTFIALPGILLAMGRFEDAKREILGFARVVRHGIVPNLLDSGANPRFNARDATWFFLHSIKDFVLNAPNGRLLLREPVTFKYPQAVICGGVMEGGFSTIGDLVVGIMRAHAGNKVCFREWNAGSAIDEQMTSEGFNVKIRLDENTGFLVGGNTFNCGTWMDKMGSSAKAGNKGHPATPRDGAPIEIVGLLRSVLEGLEQWEASGWIPKGGVRLESGHNWTWAEWKARIDANFVDYFYIPTAEEERSLDRLFVFNKNISPQAKKEFRGPRGVWRDVVMGTDEWRGFQIRPNCTIAFSANAPFYSAAAVGRGKPSKKGMTSKCSSDTPIAPLRLVRESMARILNLLSTPTSLGLKTLSPTDPLYHPTYINSDDSDNYQTANGFSYHNGPEWVWPLGHLMDALLSAEMPCGSLKGEHGSQGSGLLGGDEASDGNAESTSSLCSDSSSSCVTHSIMRLVRNHRVFIAEEEEWCGLPELTQNDGLPCWDSCRTQAWSVATILNSLMKLHRFQKLRNSEEM
eukprot:GDKJ01016462.1.p1 GENE.GDKJ01016462.1~~GDKJ01016462.1.p1  ORF type:complete len:1139 (+),score=273.80 GDKJ01016462.1:38-3418(+)